MKKIIIAAVVSAAISSMSAHAATEEHTAPIAKLTKEQMTDLLSQLGKQVREADIIPAKVSTTYAGCSRKSPEIKLDGTEYGILLPVKDSREGRAYIYYYCPVNWAEGEAPGPMTK